VIDLLPGHAGISQTPTDGLLRKACGMLDTVEPFFLYGAYQLTVDHQRRSGVTVKCVQTKDHHVG
jgi:hypothetical protein